MKAIITGGAGFVGRAFAKRLLADGWLVTVLDNLCAVGSRMPKSHPNLITLKADCRPQFNYSNHCEFDLVVHLAAVVGGRLKIDGDPLAVATDLAIDADLFSWLARAPKKPQVLYFSSSAAYPIFHQSREHNTKLEESMCEFGAGYPDKTYGMSKLVGEYLAGFAARQYGVDVKIYRPFSGYGPGQSLDYPFPSIVHRVMNHEKGKPIVVWGSGDQLRDFIYIDDVVDAVLATKDNLKPGEALNLGSGVGTSFRQLAHKIGDVIGAEVEVINDSSKPEGVFARVADATKFRSLYAKDLIPLDEGIRRVIEDLTVGSE